MLTTDNSTTLQRIFTLQILLKKKEKFASLNHLNYVNTFLESGSNLCSSS